MYNFFVYTRITTRKNDYYEMQLDGANRVVLLLKKISRALLRDKDEAAAVLIDYIFVYLH